MLSSLRNNLKTIKTGVIDQRKAAFRRLKELYREGGPSEVLRGMRDFYIYNVADEIYHGNRTDNDDRWELIESHLTEEHDSLVDLGCADGFFVKKAADRGMAVSGFEGNQNRVDRAKKSCQGYDNVNIEQKYISPENIIEILSSDVVLFLTVHHHWIRQYGWERAASMFQQICRRADLVFYEPPGNKSINRDGSEKPLAPSESIQYYTDEIQTILGENIAILDIQIVEYNDSDRADPIFVLDTSAYRN